MRGLPLLERGADRDLVVVDAVADPFRRRSRRQVAHQAGPRRIEAGEEGAAGRRAQRGGHAEVREADALRGQPIQVGRLNLFLAVAAQVTVAEVVSQNEDDVRRRCFVGATR